MPFKSWGSKTLTLLILIAGLLVGAGLKVSTQNPAVIFGNSSGAAQVIKATSNALWVSVSGVLGTLTSSVTLDSTAGNSFRRLMSTPATPTPVADNGSGSLGAGTYTIAVVCVDPAGGTSLPSATATATTAGGSSHIDVGYTVCTGYASVRVYTSAAGGATPDRYFTSTSATTYALTTLAGATVAVLPSSNTAYQFSIGSSPNWFGNVLLGPVGSVSAPTYAFAGSTNTGLLYDSSNTGLGIAIVGTQRALLNANGQYINGSVQMPSGGYFQWGSNTYVSSSDLILGRETAATLQLGIDAAGVTDQTLKGPDRITSDGVGGNLTIAGGRNRGASNGGGILWQTSAPASAGVTGTLATRGGFDGVAGGFYLVPQPAAVTSAGVALPLASTVEVTTDGNSDEDNGTLANGTTVGQIIHIYVKAVGNAADSFKITPATFLGGTKISFAASPLGKGATLVWTASGWVCIGTNGGTVS